MSIFDKFSVLLRAHTNDLLDKAIDMNSIPVVTQYILDLEGTLHEAQHQAAAAAANVTTLTNQHTTLNNSVNLDMQRAQAFHTQGNDAAAKVVLTRVVDNKAILTSLEDQITTATTASQSMDAAVEKVQTKHDDMVHQLRALKTQDANAHALEGMTKSLQKTNAITSSLDASGSVDNLAQRIQARSDVANEEFKRTVSDFQPTEVDPLKTAAVDDLFNSLTATPVAAAATAGK